MNADVPLQAAMHAAGWTSWDESALGPCLKYVWGFKNNAIPEEWRAYNEAAKRNFPLGTFRGFTYLWKIGELLRELQDIDWAKPLQQIPFNSRFSPKSMECL